MSEEWPVLRSSASTDSEPARAMPQNAPKEHFGGAVGYNCTFVDVAKEEPMHEQTTKSYWFAKERHYIESHQRGSDLLQVKEWAPPWGAEFRSVPIEKS
eukprot:12064625-Alexandrium_andersonii.AAC.1